MNIYSYPDSWGNSLHVNTLSKTIKNAYFIRSLLLLPILPFDIFYYFYLIVRRKKYNCLVATNKWLNLTQHLTKLCDVANISHPRLYGKSKISGNAAYFPASLIYVLVAFGFLLPVYLRFQWSNLCCKIVSVLIKGITCENYLLFVHSDALPFGRALVLATRQLKGTSVCIQHGIFHSASNIDERDGFLCDYNLVRSNYDADIIRKSSAFTKIIIAPEFFKININSTAAQFSTANILLLGEGYQIIDSKFNDEYIEVLQNLSKSLYESNLRIVFRPHPSERNRDWSTQFSNIDTSPIENCLANINAVVGFSSTLLHECLELGIPAFSVNVSGINSEILSVARGDTMVHPFLSVSQIVNFATHHFESCSAKSKSSDDCSRFFQIDLLIKNLNCTNSVV